MLVLKRFVCFQLTNIFVAFPPLFAFAKSIFMHFPARLPTRAETIEFGFRLSRCTICAQSWSDWTAIGSGSRFVLVSKK